jgi:DNA invertase Pin-like site-specific DNA recombinase
MDRAFGYVRVSTAGQAKEGYSLEEQRDEIRAYCEKAGLELVRIYEDAGLSGAAVDEEGLSVARPGIQQLLAELPGAGVRFVVVLTTSRLWRGDLARVLIQRELRKCRADVRAIDRPTYSIHALDKDPSAFLIAAIMEALDQYERLEIALKLRRGRAKKASLGGFAGGRAPLGYTARRGGKVLQVDPAGAATVRRAFELRDSNPEWTLDALAAVLNHEGRVTAAGRLFSKMAVKRVLDRRAVYEGTYRYAGFEAAGLHAPILEGLAR